MGTPPDEIVVLRIWMPDRPGALGHVTSRIGAVRGDVITIEVLERDNGMVIDELAIRLPDPSLVDTLVREVEQVEGARVEEVRGGDTTDPRLAALDLAATLAVHPAAELADHFLSAVVDLEGAEWGALVRPGLPPVVAGAAPAEAWIDAFVAGSGYAGGETETRAEQEVVSISAAGTGYALVLSRTGRPVRERERLELEILLRLVASRS